MDLSSQVKKIFSAETNLLSIHYWLEGMDIVNNDASLDSGLVNTYIESVTQNSKPFTPLFNYSFLKENVEATSNQKMRIIHLPVNDDSHLMFPLITEDFIEKLVYTECTPYCKVLAPYKFPDIELRKSIDFSNDPETMKSISEGMFFYDPIISIQMMDPDMIIESYNAMKNFIDYTKRN